MPDTPMKLEESVGTLTGLGDRFVLLGGGMTVHRDRLSALLGSRAVFAPPALAYLNPAAAAQLAALEETLFDYRSLMPLYLRAPSAERSRRLVEAAHAE